MIKLIVEGVTKCVGEAKVSPKSGKTYCRLDLSAKAENGFNNFIQCFIFDEADALKMNGLPLGSEVHAEGEPKADAYVNAGGTAKASLKIMNAKIFLMPKTAQKEIASHMTGLTLKPGIDLPVHDLSLPPEPPDAVSDKDPDECPF
jgi:hypothetical protein